jgi:hypothetical protein
MGEVNSKLIDCKYLEGCMCTHQNNKVFLTKNSKCILLKDLERYEPKICSLKEEGERRT